MRTFLAFDIPEFYREELKTLISECNLYQSKGIKWVNPENLHITLQFIGEINHQAVHSIREMMQENFKEKSIFDITNPKMELIPGRQPRLLWIRYLVSEKEIISSIKKVRKKISEMGCKLDFKPIQFHLTLGRIKTRVNDRFVQYVMQKSFTTKPIHISQITFYKSVLKPDGPIYEAIETVDLKEKKYGKK